MHASKDWLTATINAVPQVPKHDRVAQFQVLQSIERALRDAERPTVNEVLPGLEAALSPIIINGATPPVRRVVAGCFTIAFAKSQGSTLFTVVGKLENNLKNRHDGGAILGTVSCLELLGCLCLTSGKQLYAYFGDNVNTFCKHFKDPEPGAKMAAIAGLAKLLEGSAQMNVRPDWTQLVKDVTKIASAPYVDVRIAAARCMIVMSRHKSLLTSRAEIALLQRVAIECLEAECNGQVERWSERGRTAFSTVRRQSD